LLLPSCFFSGFLGCFFRCLLGCLFRYWLGSGAVVDRGLCSGEAGDWHAVRRAGNVGKAELVAEGHGIRISTVLTADAELDVRLGLAAFFYGDLHELANTGGVERGEWVLRVDVVFLIAIEERAHVI